MPNLTWPRSLPAVLGVNEMVSFMFVPAPEFHVAEDEDRAEAVVSTVAGKELAKLDSELDDVPSYSSQRLTSSLFSDPLLVSSTVAVFDDPVVVQFRSIQKLLNVLTYLSQLAVLTILCENKPTLSVAPPCRVVVNSVVKVPEG